ncbi:MAG: Gfo/Idh/MocA family oxidoreductase [Verrucomicrobiota bacterium]|nr:Gfo/Idh/MocA family oxidoreductase [Verrucomicrobiota bacterium]
MRKIKIFGAGSIGNHLANASRRMGWEVIVCDVNQAALDRMKNEIYPGRYGAWDESIRLCLVKDAPTGGFDLIHIGTPPEHHIPLAIEALKEEPRAILIEKPLCPPDLAGADELWIRTIESRTRVYCGFDHVVGKAALKFAEIFQSGILGKVETIDSEFREHWDGIFKAHPWLTGPEDTYLGYWKRGGGASGEHSHAINFWQHLAHMTGSGKVIEVSGMLVYEKQGKAEYDKLCSLNLKTESGLIGRVIQDVVTRPHRKRARIQGSEGYLEWIANYTPEGDAVMLQIAGKPEEIAGLPKKRPDDFICELEHIDNDLKNGGECQSPLSLERGLDTMLVVAAAHKGQAEGKTIKIDYTSGYKHASIT